MFVGMICPLEISRTIRLESGERNPSREKQPYSFANASANLLLCKPVIKSTADGANHRY